MILSALLALNIVGTWQFSGLFYDGQRIPPANPNLILIFEFHDDGHHDLTWYRTNQSGFCHRRGPYEVTDSNRLNMVVEWLDPKNTSDCGNDPDMRLGQSTSNPVSFEGDELALHLTMNGRPLLYLLRQVDPTQLPARPLR